MANGTEMARRSIDTQDDLEGQRVCNSDVASDAETFARSV